MVMDGTILKSQNWLQSRKNNVNLKYVERSVSRRFSFPLAPGRHGQSYRLSPLKATVLNRRDAKVLTDGWQEHNRGSHEGREVVEGTRMYGDKAVLKHLLSKR